MRERCDRPALPHGDGQVPVQEVGQVRNPNEDHLNGGRLERGEWPRYSNLEGEAQGRLRQVSARH